MCMFMENKISRFECGRGHQAFIRDRLLFLIASFEPRPVPHSAFNPAKYTQSGAEMKNALLTFLDHIHGHIPEENIGAYSPLSHQK